MSPRKKAIFLCVGVACAYVLLSIPTAVLAGLIFDKGLAGVSHPLLDLLRFLLEQSFILFVLVIFRKPMARYLEAGVFIESESLLLRARSIVPILVSVVGVQLVGAATTSALRMLIPQASWWAEIMDAENISSTWQRVVLSLVLAPFFEELVFRKFLISHLRRVFTLRTALFFSAFVFAFVHLDPWRLPALFGAGVFFGWVYLRSKSLIAPIGAHFGFNLFAVLVHASLNSETAGEVEIVETSATVSDLLPIVFLLGIGGVLLVLGVHSFLRSLKETDTIDWTGLPEAEAEPAELATEPAAAEEDGPPKPSETFFHG